MKLTFVDAGVLITAACGTDPTRALAILDDPERSFVPSPFLRLEVVPQAPFNKRLDELAFYEAFFAATTVWVTDVPAIVRDAETEASTYGVRAMDALHVAAASLGGAVELVTTEKPTRSIHRARSVRIVTIHASVS